MSFCTFQLEFATLQSQTSLCTRLSFVPSWSPTHTIVQQGEQKRHTCNLSDEMVETDRHCRPVTRPDQTGPELRTEHDSWVSNPTHTGCRRMQLTHKQTQPCSLKVQRIYLKKTLPLFTDNNPFRRQGDEERRPLMTSRSERSHVTYQASREARSWNMNRQVGGNTR